MLSILSYGLIIRDLVEIKVIIIEQWILVSIPVVELQWQVLDLKMIYLLLMSYMVGLREEKQQVCIDLW
ncbi:MAG: hypothetical protein BWX53_00476 [Parcubacteria group bacterium ADurb.Bin016]|nr:MAG: hypothetical protein BWX53_00476 [Parcubacteria group bacterium ADurb.Bin016]